MVNYDKVEDTFFESFDGMYIRALITAEDELTVKEAAYDATATPSAVIGRVEAGVESFVDGDKTPDGRPGAIVQFWLTDDLAKFEKVFYNKRAPVIEIISDENRDYLVKISKEMRNSIRGKDIGGLG